MSRFQTAFFGVKVVYDQYYPLIYITSIYTLLLTTHCYTAYLSLATGS